MKSESFSLTQLRSRAALAASAPFQHDTARERPALSALISDSFRQQGTRRLAGSFRLTLRDQQVVELAFRLRAFTDEQAQLALFTAGNASGCQRRLTLLVRHRYLDRLPRLTVSHPAVYLLTRRSIHGNRLMRAKWGEGEFRRHMTRLGSIDHLLALNHLRVIIERGCRDLGRNLALWQTPEEMNLILSGHNLIPDGYLQIQRVVNGETRTAAFFVELERVAKSHQVLASKLERYRQLYYSGEYQRLFGTRALRVLFVFASGPLSQRLCEHGQALAGHLGVTVARFGSLETLKTAGPAGCLTSPCWLSAGHEQPVALFPADNQGAAV